MATADKTYSWGTGRRKTAVARVRVREGSGQFLVNTLPVDDYFTIEQERATVRGPLVATDVGARVDVFVNVHGSGKSSQSDAIVMGLARALKDFRSDLEPALRAGDFMTRDPRKVERKKYGHKKARKSFQFSKR